MADGTFEVCAIGVVRSSIVDPAMAPKQGNEGSPDAWLEFRDDVAGGLRDLRVGDELVVLTWLDRAKRDVPVVHPRDDPAAPETGVFSTRSADRPNPIGLHRVTVKVIDGNHIQVCDLEAVNGTPILDVKIALPDC